MLAGTRPFGGDGPTSIMRAVLDRDPPPVDPPAAGEVVEELLVKDPDERLQSAAEAVEAVDRAADRIAAELGGEVAADSRRYWVPAPAVYGSAGLGLLLIVVGIWMALRPGPGATGGLAADRVAVLPFEVRGGPEVEFLREGIAELLSVRLHGAGGLHAVDPNTVLSRVRGIDAVDAEVGRRVAVDAGAARFVIGSVAQEGGRIRIEATYFSPRSGDEPVGSVSAEGGVERVFDLVDEIAVAMITGGLAHPEETPRSVASITTASVPALRLYLWGERALREGRFSEALVAFGGAVQEDSLFALAEHGAHVAADWGSRPDRAAEAAEAAARRPVRLPSVERRLTEGDLAWPAGLLAHAETLYVDVLRERPSSAEAWWDLGELYFHTNPLRGRPFTQAREAYQRVNALTAYDHHQALARLADLAAHDRRMADHDSLYARLDPARLTRVRRAVATFSTGDEEARAAMMESLRRGPADTVAAVADHLAGITLDLADAVQVVELLTAVDRPGGWRAVGHLRAALYEVGRGRWASAAGHLDAAEALAPDEAIPLRGYLWALPFAPYDEAALEDARAALEGWDPPDTNDGALPEGAGAPFLAPLRPALRDYLLGALAARVGDTEEVERAAGTLAARTGEMSADSLVRELGADLRARIAEDPATRVRLLLGSRPDFGRPWDEVSRSPYHSRTVARFLLGETLFGIGRLDEATRWYESFLGPLVFDVPSQGPARLRLAAIHEARGRPAEAARQYRAVLELWSDADEALAPWIDGVRQRLAALEEG
jgi:TolB-like protein